MASDLVAKNRGDDWMAWVVVFSWTNSLRRGARGKRNVLFRGAHLLWMCGWGRECVGVCGIAWLQILITRALSDQSSEAGGRSYSKASDMQVFRSHAFYNILHASVGIGHSDPSDPIFVAAPMYTSRPSPTPNEDAFSFLLNYWMAKLGFILNDIL